MNKGNNELERIAPPPPKKNGVRESIYHLSVPFLAENQDKTKKSILNLVHRDAMSEKNVILK